MPGFRVHGHTYLSPFYAFLSEGICLHMINYVTIIYEKMGQLTEIKYFPGLAVMVRRVTKSWFCRNYTRGILTLGVKQAYLQLYIRSRSRKSDGSLFYGYRIWQCYPVTCTEYGTENR